MGLEKFLSVYLFPNLELYLKILAPVALVYGIIYMKLLVSRIEIFLLAFCYLGVVFSTADVIFLYCIKQIKFEYYNNFIITSIIFYSILICCNKKCHSIFQKVKIKQVLYGEKSIFVFSLLLVIIYIILNILRVKIIGVRTARSVGGGSGIITRFLGVISPLLNFSVFYIAYYGKLKQRLIIISLYIISFFCFALLSISKSSFLSLMINLYTFMLLNINNERIVSSVKRLSIPLFIVGICGGILITMLLTASGILIAVSVLVKRFIAFGDVYIYAYPGAAIENVGNISFFRYLFAETLRTFRLVDFSYVEATNIPGQLMHTVYGAGTTGGPNPRFNIVGYAFFGTFGSLVFSFFCAFIFIKVRFFFLRSINLGFRRQLLAFFFFSNLISIEQDAFLAPKFIVNFLLFMIFISFVDLCLSYCKPSCVLKKSNVVLNFEKKI
jgi:hypothetical protein